MIKNLGCISTIAGLVITGMVVIGLSLLCFAVMAGIGETIVPEPHRQGYRDWLSGVPPDDPAFVGGTDEETTAPIPEGCWVAGGWPLAGASNGPITQGFSQDHPAVDVAVPVGTLVSSPADGTVVWAGWEDSGYGNLVIVASGATRFYMAHLAEPNVRVGQQVRAGDIVGLSGNSGRSTGPHLHYEVRADGTAIDPQAVPVDSTVRCIEGEQFATAGGGTGGGGQVTPAAADWRLPADRRGWLLAAEVDPERAGIARDETIVRAGAKLYVWPAGRSDLAVSAGAAFRGHDRVAVGPKPGTVWVVVPIQSSHEYLVSIWEK